jgi:hypothetical protein
MGFFPLMGSAVLLWESQLTHYKNAYAADSKRDHVAQNACASHSPGESIASRSCTAVWTLGERKITFHAFIYFI